MNKHIYSGGCHCGDITLTFCSIIPCVDLEPRACACDFCLKFAASYISDPNGSLDIKIKNQNKIISYTEDSSVVEFSICGSCGILTFTKFYNDDSIYAAIDARSLEDFSSFENPVIVSSRELSKEDKAIRWSSILISDVMISEWT